MTTLTKELVRAARNMMGNVSCNALGAGGAVLPVSVADLCDTCEALRAEVSRLAGIEQEALGAFAERDEMRSYRDTFRNEYHAATARAEKAERERDELSASLREDHEKLCIEETLRQKAEADLSQSRQLCVLRSNASMEWETKCKATMRELDEARVLYCCERASNGTSIYGEGDQCAWNTPRKVCDQTWPDATDALFPVEGKP